mmetsp:Transcript_94612/g.229789  ORF Transcript_94612/g.229789 Transcript_94612/m.229789 type:complete len:441 (+) Transcript_94612:56-1378(+)
MNRCVVARRASGDARAASFAPLLIESNRISSDDSIKSDRRSPAPHPARTAAPAVPSTARHAARVVDIARRRAEHVRVRGFLLRANDALALDPGLSLRLGALRPQVRVGDAARGVQRAHALLLVRAADAGHQRSTVLVVGTVTLEVEVDGAAELQTLLASDVELLHEVVHLLLGVVELALALHDLVLRDGHRVRGRVRLNLPTHHLVAHRVRARLELLLETIDLRREARHLGVVLSLELQPRHRLLLANRLLRLRERFRGAVRVRARFLDLRHDLVLLGLERALLRAERRLERLVSLRLVPDVVELGADRLLRGSLRGDLGLRLRDHLLRLTARHLLRLEVLLDAKEHVLELRVGLGFHLELLRLRLNLHLELREARRGVLLGRGASHGVVGVAAAHAGGDRRGVVHHADVLGGRAGGAGGLHGAGAGRLHGGRFRGLHRG